MRRRVATVVVGVLVASGLVATAGAANADGVGPVLTSVSVSPSTATSGDHVTLRYTATSDVPLASVAATYYFSGLSVTTTTAPGAAPAVDGSIDVLVPAGARNAVAALASVTLKDAQGASSTWGRNTHVTYSGGASGPATHTISFTAGDITVTGSTEDRESPVLTGVSMDTHAFTPGDTIRVRYDATDASPLYSVQVTMANPVKGFTILLSAYRSSLPNASPLPLSGEVSLPVDDTWANGDYRIQSIDLVDVWQQRSYYARGGSMYTVPAGSGTHTVDMSGASFTVSGSPADHEAPQLTTLGPVNVTVSQSGTVSLPYAATDASGELRAVSARFWSPAGTFDINASTMPLAGTLTGQLPTTPAVPLGVYRLDALTLTDKGGSTATYDWTGSHRENDALVAPHTFDFTTLTVAVAGRPQPASNVRATPGDRKATVTWDRDGGENYAPMTGITVTANPSGRSVTVPPSATSATITGLTNLTTYTFTVRRTNAMGASDPVSRTAMPRSYGQRIMSTGDFDGDGRYDIVGIDKTGAVRLYRGNGRGGFAAPSKVIARGWAGERMLVSSPNSHSTIRTVSYNGTLVDHYRRTTSSVGGQWDFSSGWGGMRVVADVGNWVGDVNPDVMAIRDNGDLYLYRWRATPAGLYPGVRIGRGWTVYRQVFGIGDVTGDGRNDLIGLRTDGSLWLYAGNGRGGFTGAGRKIATGFAGARAVTASYFDNKAGMDLLTVDSRGTLRLYSGTTRARFTYRGVIGTGWGGYL